MWWHQGEGKKIQKGLRVTLKRQLSVIIVVVLRKHRQLFTAPLPVSHGGSTKHDKRMGRMLSFPRGFFDCLQDVSGNLDHSSAVNVAMLFAAATW